MLPGTSRRTLPTRPRPTQLISDSSATLGTGVGNRISDRLRIFRSELPGITSAALQGLLCCLLGSIVVQWLDQVLKKP
jgi:hypothetical protein